MENLNALLHSKQSTSDEMQDIRIQSSINTNLQNVNVVASANNLGYINDVPRASSSSSCLKCQELYNLLNQHFLENHSNDLNNDKDSTSILKNILTSILALLTASNKTNQEPGLDKAIPNLSVAQTNTSVLQKAATPTNELPQLGSLVPQESVASRANLEKLLKSAQLNSSRNVEQGGGEQEKRKTVLQGISLLDAGVQIPGSMPLVFTNQLSRDGSSHPAMVAASALPKTSEKSDLDVADILVNKMPIPSVNKEESSLAQLYLKQLAEGLATGRPDILKDTEGLTDNIVSDRDLLNALLNFNNSTGCSIAAGPTANASQKPMVETITQIMAAQKQLTNLLSLLGKRQSETPLLPVAGLATQLIETPLNNPLFINQQQKAAPPGMLQIPLSSILPALAPSTQGIIQGGLIQQPVSANAGNNTIPLANLFTRTTQAYPANSTNKTIAVPALALPTSMLQSSAIPILQQTIQTSLQSTTQPTVLMSSVIPAAISSSLPTTLFSTQTSLQSLIVPGKSISGVSTQSSSPKTFFTLPQTTIPSLTEQLFQNASTIPKLALSTTLPSVFNLGNIPGISVLHAGLQSQSQTRLQGGVTTRPIPLAPSTSVIVSSGTQHANQAVDKIQGLIHAAVNNPKKPTAIVTSPNFSTTSHQNRGLFSKRKSSTLGTSPVKNPKIDGSESREKTEPTKLYRCQTCHTTFSVLSTLQQHEQSHLGTKMQCNYCNDVFSDVATFQEHISLHRGQENVHQCEYCTKIFTSRGELQKHLVEHTQKRPYKCTYCAKSFRDPGSLQKHERIHTGERPYKCPDCSKAFAEYSSLRKHNRVHTGEKPYKCPHCPKAFSISGNLQRHLYIHTGERPYRCTKCPKAFNNPSHLRRHVKNLHEWKKEGSASTQGSGDELEVAPIDAE